MTELPEVTHGRALEHSSLFHKAPGNQTTRDLAVARPARMSLLFEQMQMSGEATGQLPPRSNAPGAGSGWTAPDLSRKQAKSKSSL